MSIFELFAFFFSRLPLAEHLRDIPERQLRPPDRRSGNTGGRRGRERNSGVSGDDTPSSGIVGNEALGGGGAPSPAW